MRGRGDMCFFLPYKSKYWGYPLPPMLSRVIKYQAESNNMPPGRIHIGSRGPAWEYDKHFHMCPIFFFKKTMDGIVKCQMFKITQTLNLRWFITILCAPHYIQWNCLTSNFENQKLNVVRRKNWFCDLLQLKKLIYFNKDYPRISNLVTRFLFKSPFHFLSPTPVCLFPCLKY